LASYCYEFFFYNPSFTTTTLRPVEEGVEEEEEDDDDDVEKTSWLAEEQLAAVRLLAAGAAPWRPAKTNGLVIRALACLTPRRRALGRRCFIATRRIPVGGSALPLAVPLRRLTDALGVALN